MGPRRLLSGANLTGQDARDGLPLAVAAAVRPRVTPYGLADAKRALDDLRAGALTGAAGLMP